MDGGAVSLDLYAEVLRDPQMLDALAAAAERGVRVRIIIAIRGFCRRGGSVGRIRVDIRLSSRLYIHAKLIVADGERAFVGSQNLSATSLDQNRELGIIVDDPVNLSRLTWTFAIDFRAAEVRGRRHERSKPRPGTLARGLRDQRQIAGNRVRYCFTAILCTA